MSQGYWKKGLAERQSVFYSTFRTSPFNGGFTVFCGLGTLADFMDNFGFAEDDLIYLSGLENPDGTKLFERDFLKYLERLKFSCDLFSVPEGSVVFPSTPLIRIKGPIVQCQILETPILNITNHQSLIATKAARICMAAEGQPVMEFGFRRAHGSDGAISCSRAAFVGGCSATSNVIAGKKFGIPVKGTMAHSWVMMFDSEVEAFEHYADVSGSSFVLLVDTYETIEGVKNAVKTAEKMREKGKKLAGVRLDSGDMLDLSVKTRKILDEKGFRDAVIIASNDLDEYAITDLKNAGAPIDAWGVGTRLVTSAGHSAIDGIYKLSAIENASGEMEPRMKLSNHPIKNSMPGCLQTRRYIHNGLYAADIIYDQNLIRKDIKTRQYIEDTTGSSIREALDLSGTTEIHPERFDSGDDLLKKIYECGNMIYDIPEISQTRKFFSDETKKFCPDIFRIRNHDKYMTGIEKNLYEFRCSFSKSHSSAINQEV
jgi:nicotinate phosphoribosyltransferase